MNTKKDMAKLERVYKSMILNEASPREYSMTGKAFEPRVDNPEDYSGPEDQPVSSSPLMKGSEKPIKFPGRGVEPGRFYLPYIKHFQNTYGVKAGAQFGEMIARLAQAKIEDEFGGSFTGSETEFRSQVLAPLVRDVVDELGVSKGVNELTSGYIARSLMDAFEAAGYVQKGEKLGGGTRGGGSKPEPKSLEDLDADIE